MFTSILLAIASGIFVSFEIVVYEYITKNNQDINTDALVWIYRLGSIIFISIFIIYRMLVSDEEYKNSLKDTFKFDEKTGWYVLLSALAAASIITFFRSIDAVEEESAGIPVAVRSLYIPLAFVLSVLLVKRGKWSIYSWPTYAGMVGVVGSVGLIIYGSSKVVAT